MVVLLRFVEDAVRGCAGEFMRGRRGTLNGQGWGCLTMERFRLKKRIRVPYHVQGYVFFLSQRYKNLPKWKRERILLHCKECGGEHWRALLAFVTTDAGAVEICRRYYISESTLERVVARYYEEWPEDL